MARQLSLAQEGKRKGTRTNYFFAINRKEAIAYAKKVNAKKGFTFIPINTIRLAKVKRKQEFAKGKFKTWAFTMGRK